MSSVEDNANIEKAFNDILKEEYRDQWELIVIPRYLIATFCYAIPATLMISSNSYHNHNVLAVLFFSFIIGTGFYSYYCHNRVLHAFFTDKPSTTVIKQVRASAKFDTPLTTSKDLLTEEEEADWSLIVNQLEQSMETHDDSDEMNVSTLFDRAETESATLEPKKLSWFQRLFGRMK